MYQLEGYPVPSGIPVGRPIANTVQGRPTPGAEQLRLGDASYPVMSRGERKGGLLGWVVNCLSSQSLGARGVKVAAMRTAVGPLLPGKGGFFPTVRMLAWHVLRARFVGFQTGSDYGMVGEVKRLQQEASPTNSAIALRE